jgi:hypothetical protein
MQAIAYSFLRQHLDASVGLMLAPAAPPQPTAARPGAHR